MRTYWLSTPRWTCQVTVAPHGDLVRVAPILHRQWHGRQWAALLHHCRSLYGARFQYCILPERSQILNR